MSYSIKETFGKKITATDEESGSVKDLYFDDDSQRIVYLIVDTGNWLPGRRVLISPQVVTEFGSEQDDQSISVNLTSSDIENSPSIRDDMPVSKQMEIALHQHFAWQPYWSTSTMGLGADALSAPPPVATNVPVDAEISTNKEFQNEHLRSAKEVIGYSVTALGQSAKSNVQDILIDPDKWNITHFIIDTKPWFFGGHKVVAAENISRIDYNAATIEIEISVEDLNQCPDA